MEYLIAIGLGFVALIAAFLSGRNDGRDSVKLQQKTEVLDNVKLAKKISEDIDDANVDELRDKLRNNK